MELQDLLVSYNQIDPPQQPETTPLVDRYDNMLQFLQQKENPQSSNDNSNPKFQWIYNRYKKPKELQNNNPIMSKNEWVIQLSQAYRDLGVSENGIRNLIAKNALESGWGQSTQGRYNYGNITTGSSWGGSYVNGRDHDANGNPIRNKFRSYNSLREFAADEIQFLKRLYDFNDSDNIDTFLSKLQGGNSGGRKYAGDPSYKTKVKSVYNGLR